MRQSSAAPAPRARASLIVALLGFALQGSLACAASGASRVAPGALGRDLPVFQPNADVGGRPTPSTPAVPDTVSLREALALVLLQSPRLAAFAWEIRVQESRAVPAGVLPNPVVSVLAEDIRASNDLTSLPADQQLVQPQSTIQMSQLVELGGKRTARRRSAVLTAELAAWDYETARMDALTQATHAFIDVLAAQESVRLTEQLTDLVADVQRVVAARVEAGDVSPVEESRATVALASARVESGRANRMLEVARLRLAAMWGATAAEFVAVAGDLSVAADAPSLSELERQLQENPDLARWRAELAQREAALAEARSRRVPDVTLIAGYREFTTLGGSAMLIGASFPLPLFDRNAGGIDEERSRLAKGREEQRAAESRVRTDFAEAYRALTGTYAEVMALQETVLPMSRQTFEAVSEGYRLGRFSFLDVLDAQRTLISASSQYVRARADFGKAVADVERLTGTPLPRHQAVPR